MSVKIIGAILALAPQPAQPGQPTLPVWANMVPLVLIIFVFYFALIRPQQKKAREQANMLKALKPGDKVATNGGIVGVVVAVKDKTLSLRSADAKLEVLKGAVTEVLERSNSPTTEV
jgi:preprotein translocase subunit YajC